MADSAALENAAQSTMRWPSSRTGWRSPSSVTTSESHDESLLALKDETAAFYTDAETADHAAQTLVLSDTTRRRRNGLRCPAFIALAILV